MRTSPLIAIIAALLAPAPALAATSAVDARLADDDLSAGEPARVVGLIDPAADGVPVVLERRDDAGGWRRVGRQETAAGGAFAFRWVPGRGGVLRVRAADADAASAAASAELALAVRPRLVLPQPVRLEAFVGGTLRVPVRPRSYAGTAAVVLLQGQRVLARREARVRDGHLVVEVPMPAYGAFRVRLVLPARDGLARADEERRGIALPRDVAYGATGPAVRALVRRLKALRIYVPEPTDAFDAQVQDSVIAFQKAYDLERTGAVDADVWRRLFASRPLEPARRTPATHIEVDLRRQILVKVIGGEVARVIPISSGATGNTPTGVFTVQRKDTATTSLFGGLLYDVLTYHGNFAIHGYPDVPPWPASHGCTRVPSWIAPWLFAQSSAGETVVNL